MHGIRTRQDELQQAVTDRDLKVRDLAEKFEETQDNLHKIRLDREEWKRHSVQGKVHNL
jgi:DNA-binding Xre family transcriptional regulator